MYSSRVTSAPSETPTLGDAPRVDDPEGRRAKASIASALFGDAKPEAEVLGGRYALGRRLGAGGMGVVYEAHDPQLDRPVAVKLLHPEASADARARARMVREARALAKLSHPHVIQVYDVGDEAEQVFVAMELVPGQTLGKRAAALREQGDWRAILDLYLDAGRGLAAAHEAGLVHRDFKPENVLVGDDGRARVLDFGLARPVTVDEPPGETEGSDAGEDPEQARDSKELASALTRAGAVVGTPRYMAPEQLAGQAANAASDQYGFCVSLYEGLYGLHPFGGSAIKSLLAVAKGGTAPTPRRPERGPIPTAVFEVLERGLEVDPEARWPDLDALLVALQGAAEGRRPPTPPRRRSWLLAGVGAALVVAVGVAGALSMGPRGPAAAAPAPETTGAPGTDTGDSDVAEAAGEESVPDLPLAAAVEAEESSASGNDTEDDTEDDTGGEAEEGTGGETASEPATTRPRPKADWCHLHEDTYKLLQRGAKARKTLKVGGTCYTCRVESRKSRTERFTPRCGGYRLCGPTDAERCG